jgi:hypothetical protein
MASVLLVEMPFAPIGIPAPGLEVLRLAAERHGCRASTRHFNLDFATDLGPADYWLLSHAEVDLCLGEWVFAPFGGSSTQITASPIPTSATDFVRFYHARDSAYGDPHEALRTAAIRARDLAEVFLERCVDEVTAASPDIVGLTCVVGQTSAVVALARAIRQALPAIKIVVGGPNCRSVPPDIADLLVFGPGEVAFVEYLIQLGLTVPTSHALVAGKMHIASDPPYASYFAALGSGVLKDTPVFIQWQPEFGAIADLSRSLPDSRTRDTVLHINDCNREHLGELATSRERLAEAPQLFSREVDVGFDDAAFRVMRDRGVRSILFDLDTLSSGCYRRLGYAGRFVNALNILLLSLRYGIHPLWKLTYGVPGDCASDYEPMPKLVRLLHHVHPPYAFSPFCWPLSGSAKGVNARWAEMESASLSNAEGHVSVSVASTQLPRPLLESARSAVESWWAAHHQSALFYVRKRDSLIVFDMRDSSASRLLALQGLPLHLYLACGTPIPIADLSRDLSVSPREMAWAASVLEERGLIFLEDEIALALATPIGDYAPPAAVRDRMAQDLPVLSKAEVVSDQGHSHLNILLRGLLDSQGMKRFEIDVI